MCLIFWTLKVENNFKLTLMYDAKYPWELLDILFYLCKTTFVTEFV